MAAVSIIVPVYNAEAYLERCIDSILSQSCPDIEYVRDSPKGMNVCLYIVRRMAERGAQGIPEWNWPAASS